MPDEKVKGSATTYAGYRYQTLQGVKVLVDWLESPTIFTRVKFECDDRTMGPQGLDDIVAERPDGKLNYWQIKYTPPQSAKPYHLDWEWLTNKKDAARSFLQKWANAVDLIPSQQLGEARLITNREPDRPFSRCLDGEFVIFDNLETETQTLVKEQLGGEEKARAFFSVLRIQHSDRSFNNLEATVRARLNRLSFRDDGIDRLFVRSHSWASFKNDPMPDGWLTLDLIREVLAAAKPNPMPQDFEIPAGYEPPDSVFHDHFLQEIENGPTTTLTLFGPPGRGKSTYLSCLCKRLESEKVPFVRHHYFLSVVDSTFDRLSPLLVAQSILEQINRHHPSVNAPTERPEDLRNALEACGSHYAAEEKPFVLIIDGLDHVWRENYGDIRPLDDIFKQILPLPKNVKLLVGTQPVSDDKLPKRLVSECPRNSWIELPTMTGDAIHSYLERQVQSGRWLLPHAMPEQELREQAQALFDLTKGHPLHLIYSVEALVTAGNPLSVYDIEQLPACPGDDIRSYYRELWQTLGHEQQDVLHLICELPFRWPRNAFSLMSASPVPGTLSLDGIEHLLHATEGRLSPFHQSLIVFVNDQTYHKDHVQQLLPLVEEWLENSAEPILKNSWLWSVKALMGDSHMLRTGVTRNWVLDRLAEGYPVETFVRMLTEAEILAFEEKNYAETYRHRNLKIRLLNGPDFQLDDAPSLIEASWTVSSDQSAITDAWVSRHELPTQLLPGLAVALQHHGHEEKAHEVAAYARHRWNTESEFKTSQDPRLFRAEAAKLGEAIASCKVIDCDNEIENRLIDKRPLLMVKALAMGLMKAGDLQALMSLREVTESPKRSEVLENLAVRLAAYTGAKLSAWSEFSVFSQSSLAAVYGWLSNSAMKSIPSRPVTVNFTKLLDWDSRQKAFQRLVYEWFMKSLCTALYAEGEFSWVNAPSFQDRENLTVYLDRLREAAEDIANRFKSKEKISYHQIFDSFSTIDPPPGQSYQTHQVYNDFRKALLLISIDLHLLNCVLAGEKAIDVDDIGVLKGNAWGLIKGLPEAVLSIGLPVLNPDALVDVLYSEKGRLVAELQETCTIAQDLTRLCRLATLHEHHQQGRELCRLAWDITIGYGHRKDPALDSALTSIEYLSDQEPETAKAMLHSLAPQISNVCDYTDGSGTRHIPSFAASLMAKLDRRSLVSMYIDHIRNGNWSDAESCMQSFLQTVSKNSPELLALAQTGLAEIEYDAIKNADDGRGEVASSAVSFLNRAVNSGEIEGQGEDQKPESLSSKFSGKPEDYAPSKIEKLLSDLKTQQVFGSDFLKEWFDYWVSQGKSSTLLRQVKPLALKDETRGSGPGVLLDRLTKVSLELNGATDPTFELAVTAQSRNYGWSPYIESWADSEWRLRTVAEHFPSRADEFITKSTTNDLLSRRNASSLVVPGEKLVFFMVQLGRFEEAIQIAREMVNCIIEETSSLVLPQPSWW